MLVSGINNPRWRVNIRRGDIPVIPRSASGGGGGGSSLQQDVKLWFDGLPMQSLVTSQSVSSEKFWFDGLPSQG